MTKREQILKDIEMSNKRLFRAWQLLKDENIKGKQFDFVNAPRLSDLTNCLISRAELINEIVYQKAKY
jgi:hypothetical protein